MNDDSAHDVDKSIKIGQDAIGNAIISGSGNVVIIESTATRRESHNETAEQHVVGTCPYVGLSAFIETDAERFFGREKQIQRLWGKLRDLSEEQTGGEAPTRLLPILGPSGSGKSSLARAGLIPELARRPLPGLREPRVVVFTPGARPIESLSNVLARTATDDPAPVVAKAHAFYEMLSKSDDDGEYHGLRRIVDSLPEVADSPIVVFVDQFEEIYSLCDSSDERLAFIENLLHAAGDANRHATVVITLRTDFLGETQRHRRLNSLICSDRQQVMVPAMRSNELHEAISRPAELAGHPLDEALINQMVADTRDREGALPLLQFALTRIWDGLSNGIDAVTTYKEIGGVGGALAGEAQRIYEKLSDEDRKIARHVFLSLVQLGEGTRDTRRRTTIDTIISVGVDEEHLDRVIRRFAGRQARLITLSAPEQGEFETAEVTHEALFDHWELLNQWLDEDRDDLRFHRRLEDAARAWDQNDQAGGDLWRPPTLDLLRGYHERGGELTPIQMQFFQASDEAERTRIAKERKQQRLLKTLVGTAASAALIAIIMLVLALKSASTARTEAENAESAQGVAELAKENVEREKEKVEQQQENTKAALEKAQSARDEAARRLRQAREAVDIMLTDVSGLLALFPGVQELRIKMLEKAAEDYDRFATSDASAPDLLVEVGHTYLRLGDVQLLLERPKEAKQAYDKGKKVLEDLDKAHPQNTEYGRLLARAHGKLGDVLETKEDSEQAYIAALKILEGILKSNPWQHSVRAERAQLQARYGRLLSNESMLAKAIEELQANPNVASDHDVQFELANARHMLGQLQNQSGRHAEAKILFQQSTTALSELLVEHPNDPRFLHAFIAVSSSRANAIKQLGHNPTKIYQTAELLLTNLLSALPDVPVFQERLAVVRHNRGQYFIESGQCDEAKKLLDVARDMLMKLAARHPGNEAFLFHWAMADVGLARSLTDLGEDATAIGLLGEAVQLFEALSELLPNDPQIQDGLARSYRARGQLSEKLRNKEDARENYRNAIACFEKSLKDNPIDDVYSRTSLAWTYVFLARVSEADEATDNYTHGLQEWKKLDERNSPAALFGHSWLLAKCKDQDIRDSKLAIELAQKAVGLFPENAKHVGMLGVAYYEAEDFGNSLDASGRAKEKRFHPDSIDYFYIAMARWKLGKKEAAMEDYSQAVAILEENRPGNFERIQIREEASILLELKPPTAESTTEAAKESEPSN